jgi:acetyltransferase-like isoleucine patch superfamily enzyme
MPLPLNRDFSRIHALLSGDLESKGRPPTLNPRSLAPFESAGEMDLAVLPRRASPLQIRACRAGVVVGNRPQQADWVIGSGSSDDSGWFLRVEDAGWALWQLLDGPCRPGEDPEDWLPVHETIERHGAQARTAMVHRSAVVGAGTWIGSGAVLHPRVRVGESCRIGEGTIVGAPGFGMIERAGRLWPLPHWAGVTIDSDVWIGPQCQISSGLLEPTYLGQGARLDAQIQVGHNSRIGAGSVLAGQSGLAGSVVLGAGCLVGGKSAIAEHVVLGDGCQVAACSGVTRSWPAGTRLAGFPAVPHRVWKRTIRAGSDRK